MRLPFGGGGLLLRAHSEWQQEEHQYTGQDNLSKVHGTPRVIEGKDLIASCSLAEGFSRQDSGLLFLSPQFIGLCKLARSVRGAAQLLVFVRQEGMRLAGIRSYRRGLFQVGQRFGKSAVQKQHAPQKQVCAVMVRLSLQDFEQVFGCFLWPSSAGIN